MERKVAEVFPPGEYIRDELEARGWTQSDLAEILGRSRPKVNELIQGKRAITLRTARELAAAFGTSAQVWLNLETQWQLWRNQSRDQSIENGVAHRAKLREARTFGRKQGKLVESPDQVEADVESPGRVG